jgi:magnesium-transporting ATPase (P-type)
MRSPDAIRPPHASSLAELLQSLGSDGDRGMAAHAVALRFLQQFHDPLLYTLLAVGAVKLLSGAPREALAVWSVTLINGVIGFVQESRAETAIAALASAVPAGALQPKPLAECLLRHGASQPAPVEGVHGADAADASPFRPHALA